MQKRRPQKKRTGTLAATSLVVVGLAAAVTAAAPPHVAAPVTAATSRPFTVAATAATAATAAITNPALTRIGFLPSAARPAQVFHSPVPALAPAPRPVAVLPAAVPVIGALGIPELVLAAYHNAERMIAASDPSCGLPWNLLAGIGRIESGHAGGGRTDVAGTTITPVLGPVLDGTLAGNNLIADTDHGVYDGDALHDRAVGPMQFIPSTWAKYASDGNADGVKDINNVFDATLAAGKYLCSGGLDLRDPAQQSAAVFRYNNSPAYVADVLAWSAAYAVGGTPTPDQLQPVKPPSPVAALTKSVDAPIAPADPAATTPATPTPPPGTFIIPGLPPIPCGIFCPVTAPAAVTPTVTPNATPDATQPAAPTTTPAVPPAKP